MSEFIAPWVMHEEEVLLDEYRHAMERFEEGLQEYVDPWAELKQLLREMVSRAARRFIDQVLIDAGRHVRGPRVSWPSTTERLRHQVIDRRIAIAPKARSSC